MGIEKKKGSSFLKKAFNGIAYVSAALLLVGTTGALAEDYSQYKETGTVMSGNDFLDNIGQNIVDIPQDIMGLFQ